MGRGKREKWKARKNERERRREGGTESGGRGGGMERERKRDGGREKWKEKKWKERQRERTRVEGRECAREAQVGNVYPVIEHPNDHYSLKGRRHGVTPVCPHYGCTVTFPPSLHAERA